MNILITAAGGGGTNGILETFNDEGITFVGVNSDYYKAAASCIEITYQVAHARYPQEYLNDINAIVDKHGIDFIVPNSDIEVELLSKYSKELNCSTFVPKSEIIEISNDKFKTYKHCLKHGINVPKTIDFSSIEDLKSKFDFTEFPIWCRVKEGSGSKNTAPVNSLVEAIGFIHSEIEKFDLKIEDFTLSDFLPGDDCLITSIWIKGKLKYLAMAHRMKYAKAPGQSPPVLIKKMFRQELMDLNIQVAQSFEKKPNGIYNIDVKYDRNGRIALTELNMGRFYYNMPLFNKSNDANMFKYYLDVVVYGKDNPAVISKDELFFLRDQDKFPVVFSELELTSKLSKL